MFDSIIGYALLQKKCETLICNHTVPSSILISGAPYTGKLSFALDFARQLLCEKNNEGLAPTACSCASCRTIAAHHHPDIKILGKRNFLIELDAHFNVLIATKKEQSRIAFLLLLKKLIARADFIIWETTESWNNGIKSASILLVETLFTYEHKEKDNKHFPVTVLKELYTQALKLIQSFPSQVYTVKNIRNLIAWTKTSSHSKAKIVILENVDKMSATIENMLLKTLEESPEAAFFFLLSDNPQALLDTTHSRLFHIRFPHRSVAEEEQVIEKVFGVSKEYYEENANTLASAPITSIYNFMQVFSQSRGETLSSVYAKRYVQALEKHHHFDTTLLAFLNTGTGTKAKISPLFFLETLRQYLHHQYFFSKKYAKVLPLLWQQIESAHKRIETYHLMPRRILEVLFYSLAQLYEKFSL